MRLAICLFFTAITAWGAPAPRTVDLSTLDAPSTPSSGSGSNFKPAISYSGAGVKPGGEKIFKVFFDLALYSRPGVTPLSFGNFHSYVFLDILPRENIQFSFDLASARGSPSFYELDWQIAPWVQLRAGKIWIPFDDMSPHNLFGGRINVSTLAPPGGEPFLPSLWTDLGTDLVIFSGGKGVRGPAGTGFILGRPDLIAAASANAAPNSAIGRVCKVGKEEIVGLVTALELFVEIAREWRAAGRLKDRSAWAAECEERKRTMLRRTHFDQVPIKPQRVYEEMNKAFGRDTCYVTTIGLSQIAAAQFLHVYKPRNWLNAGQAGPLGWTIPAALGAVVANPAREVVAISGDYDFQFLIEELAVGAQFNLPYLHVVVNNAYLGLIRQAQRAFDMDYNVQLSFDNINAPELNGAGVDHVAVALGLGCKAVRVTEPSKIADAFAQARALMKQHRVPVVVEVMLERVTNIAMGAEIDNINEFEPVSASIAEAPTSVVGARRREPPP